MRTPLSARFAVAAVVLCAQAVALCGCTPAAPGSAPDPAARLAPSFRTNPRTFALPIKSDLPDDLRLDHAQSVYVSACMAKEGFSWPSIDPARYLPPVFNRAQRRLFSVAIAARYGYGLGPIRTARAPRLDSLPLAGRKMYQDCVTSSVADLRLDDPVLLRMQSLSLLAYLRAKASRPVALAIARWKQCMAPLHLGPVPGPLSMPTARQRVEFRATPGATRDAPGSAEIHDAVADARCRSSSGFDAVSYRTEVREDFIALATDSRFTAKAIELSASIDRRAASVLSSTGR